MAEPAEGTPGAVRDVVRPERMDREPGAGLGQALLLLDELDRAARRLRPVVRTVERLSGVTSGQARALMSLADDDPTASGTPRNASFTRLARKGLVAPIEPGTGPGVTGWRLTDAGRAALEQIQGLRIRIVHTAIAELDAGQVDQVRASIRRVGDTLRTTGDVDA